MPNTHSHCYFMSFLLGLFLTLLLGCGPDERLPERWATCDDIQTRQSVWNSPATGVDLSDYTDGQLKYLGCAGFRCSEPFRCEYDSVNHILDIGGVGGVRAMIDPGNENGDDWSYDGERCCDKALGPCAAPIDKKSVHAMCRALGYRGGKLIETTESAIECPGIRASDTDGKEWTSDFTTPAKSGQRWRCYRHYGIDFPEVDFPELHLETPQINTPKLPGCGFSRLLTPLLFLFIFFSIVFRAIQLLRRAMKRKSRRIDPNADVPLKGYVPGAKARGDKARRMAAKEEQRLQKRSKDLIVSEPEPSNHSESEKDRGSIGAWLLLLLALLALLGAAAYWYVNQSNTPEPISVSAESARAKSDMPLDKAVERDSASEPDSTLDDDGKTVAAKGATQPPEAEATKRHRLRVRDISAPSAKCRSAIAYLLDNRNDQLKFCQQYRRGESKPSVNGKIRLSFLSGKGGKVFDLKAVEDSLNKENLSDCLQRRLKTWRFPRDCPGEIGVTFVYADGN